MICALILAAGQSKRMLRPKMPLPWGDSTVLGHILDTERIFAYRGLCVARGETNPLPGFEQDDYVATGAFGERKLGRRAVAV